MTPGFRNPFKLLDFAFVMQEKISQQHGPVIDLALDTISKGKQALVFVNSKPSAEKQAEEISKRCNGKLDELAEKVLNVLSTPTKQCKRLAGCIKKGIAFHHAGLDQKQKELIEDGFRAGEIKIICCTPTLAAGMDLPAFRTILTSLKRYTNHGMDYIPVLEYEQMAGRAGRPKYDSYGEAICIAGTDAQKEELIEKYLNGEVEHIYSKLAAEPVLRTYVLSLISSGLVRSKEDLMKFFSRTFFAFQFKDLKKIEELLVRVLGMLKDWGFVKGSSNEDFVSADSMNEKYIVTLLGKRVVELYLDPLTANKLVEGLKKKCEKNEFSYLQLISHTLEMRPLLRIKKSEYEEVQEKIALIEENLLEDGFFDEFEDFENSIKTAWFFEEWINESSEEQLLEKFGVRPGEIKYKLNLSDWLLFSCIELSKLSLLNENVSNLTKLRVRLKYGIKEELMPLVRLKGIGKTRARKLYSNGIKDVRGLKKIGLGELKLLIGEKTAENIKKQLEMG